MDKCSRKERTNFTMLSNEILRDSNLSYKAKGLVCVIMGLPKNWDFSVKGIASISKEGETSVRSSIRELIKAGFCAWQNIYENNKIKYREYYFSDEKADVKAQIEKWDKTREERKKLKGQKQQNLDFGKLDEGNLNEANLNEGNRNQINNIKNNIKKDKENNKEKTLFTESEKGADAPTHNDNDIDDKKLRERLSHKYNDDEPVSDIEVKFYLGMEKKYPRIMRMDVPLKYSQYQQLLKDGVSNKKIIANLESMENWKPLNSKRVIAYQTLLNFIKGDRNEYPQEMA